MKSLLVRAFKETFKLFELCTLFKEKISRCRTRRKEGEGEMRGEEICRFVEIVLMVTYFCRNYRIYRKNFEKRIKNIRCS